MLRASIIFFVLGIVSMLLGINSITDLSIDIEKILLFSFLILSIISFFVGCSNSKRTILMTIFFLTVFSNVHADDSISERAKELANDSKRATENAVRVAKDKTCEMVNGKMECAIQKVKHGIQKAAAEAEDVID